MSAGAEIFIDNGPVAEQAVMIQPARNGKMIRDSRFFMGRIGLGLIFQRYGFNRSGAQRFGGFVTGCKIYWEWIVGR